MYKVGNRIKYEIMPGNVFREVTITKILNTNYVIGEKSQCLYELVSDFGNRFRLCDDEISESCE